MATCAIRWMVPRVGLVAAQLFVGRVSCQVSQSHVLQCGLVRRTQKHLGWKSGFECLLVAARAEAPTVAWLEACKAVLWAWRRQVVACLLAELEELSSHYRTNRVRASVLAARVAAAIAEKTRERFVAARL